MEIIHTLGINWMTLTAQLVNFGILLTVLTYFLYRPILRVLDERREKIAHSLDEAKSVTEQMKALKAEQATAMKALDAKHASLLAEAKKEAEKTKAELIAAADKEAKALLERGREQLQSERSKMVADLGKTVAMLSVKIAGKILEKEFSDADQKRILTSLEKDVPSLIR